MQPECSQDMSNTCLLNAETLPKVLAFKLRKWDNRQVEQWFSYIYARDMAKNCPRYIPDMPEICASFARGVGIQIEKVGQNVAGEGA